MASIDSLPADQRAVLELVLRRGRSYDEIARLLSIDRAGVRQRALAAFDALGPRTRVAADRRALITDYLLDALPGGVADEVRDHLRASASERAWARAIASELQGLSEHPLPEVPSNGHAPRTEGDRRRAVRAPGAATGPQPKPSTKRRSTAEVPVAAALSNGSPRERSPRRPSSRVGGAVLLGLAAAVAIVLVLVFVVFTGSDRKHTVASSHRTTHSSTTAASSSSPKPVARVNLRPPRGGTSPIGVAEVVNLQGKLGIVLAAKGLTPNRKHPPNYYAVWLSNSPTSGELVGFAGAVGSKGQLETAGAFPANWKHYKNLLVTLETTGTPKAPGRIVLEGRM